MQLVARRTAHAFAFREGGDDDLVLAVALACWYGEHCMRELCIF
jgi:hypothetical protein